MRSFPFLKSALSLLPATWTDQWEGAIWSQVRTCWEAGGEPSGAWRNPPQGSSHYGVPRDPVGFRGFLFRFNSVWKYPAQLTKLCKGPSVGIKWKPLACPSLVYMSYLTSQDAPTGEIPAVFISHGRARSFLVD